MQLNLVFSTLNQSNVFFFTLIADYWKYVIFVPWLSCCTSRKNEKKYKRIRLTGEHWNQASKSRLAFSNLELTQDHVLQARML